MEGQHTNEVYSGPLPALNLTEKQLHAFLENRLIHIGGVSSLKSDYPEAYLSAKSDFEEFEAYEILGIFENDQKAQTLTSRFRVYIKWGELDGKYVNRAIIIERSDKYDVRDIMHISFITDIPFDHFEQYYQDEGTL